MQYVREYFMSDVGKNIDAGEAFCMELQERTWFGFRDIDRDMYKALWEKRAEKAGKKVVVLRLVPDALFPMFGKEQPYIEWQERLETPKPETLANARASELYLAFMKRPHKGDSTRDTYAEGAMDALNWFCQHVRGR